VDASALVEASALLLLESDEVEAAVVEAEESVDVVEAEAEAADDGLAAGSKLLVPKDCN